MPIDHRFDHEHGCIEVRCRGEITFDEVIQALDAMYRDPAYDRPWDELWDLAEVDDIRLSSTYLTHLRDFEERLAMIKGHPRCAVACERTVLYGMAKMYETLWHKTPLKVKAFKHRAQAEAWLAEDGDQSCASR